MEANTKYFFSIQPLCFNMHQKYFMKTSHFVTQNIKKDVHSRVDIASSKAFLSETDFFPLQVHGGKEYND